MLFLTRKKKKRKERRKREKRRKKKKKKLDNRGRNFRLHDRRHMYEV